MRTGALLAALACAALGGAPRVAHAEEADQAPAIERWCAPELEELAGSVCFHPPAKEAAGPKTLVVFLHGVVQPGSDWQLNQQRNAARIADAHGFTVIMPRGRRGGASTDEGGADDAAANPPGPRGMEDWWVWPTGVSQQKAFEDSVIAEWQAARDLIEKRTPTHFERIWIFGFSNGGYYATSLAMRGRLVATGQPSDFVADGFAVFAGGSGAPYLERNGKGQKTRPAIFVAWGGKDKAHADQQALAAMLKRIGWASKSLGEKNEGHIMSDRAVKDAVAFLDAVGMPPDPVAVAAANRPPPRKTSGAAKTPASKGTASTGATKSARGGAPATRGGSKSSDGRGAKTTPRKPTH